MNDRIKIAEAMGYAFIPLTDSWLTPCGKRTVKKLPDPFTSADDDYACLQHMVEKYGVREAGEILEHRTCAQYFIGAFAKGLLEKLNET